MPIRRRPGAVRLPAVVALASAALLLVGACGGGERAADRSSRAAPTTTSTVAYAQWQAALDSACAALNDRFAALADAQPADAAGAIAYAAEVDRFVQGLTDAVDEAGTPSARRDEVEELQQGLDDLAEATRALARAADDRDAAAVTRATTTVGRLATQVNPLAVSLGVPACGGF